MTNTPQQFDEAGGMGNLERPKCYDIINPEYWYQGSFINSSKYNHMGQEWKDERTEEEKTIIRDKRSLNPVFQVSGSIKDDSVVEAIISWRDYALALEKRLSAVGKGAKKP